MGDVILEMKDIVKKFPGVLALKGAGLHVRNGEVTALLGENGAGKSTLMKILTGVHKKDSGQILYDGREVEFTNYRQASEAGIAIIHQELNLIPRLRIYENVFLGRELTKPLGALDIAAMVERTRELLALINVHLDPTREVKGLSIAMQQMVEIAKALSLNARVIVMDEPTDALPDEEVDSLFGIIEELKKQGKGIVYITHRLGEVFRICDRATVLRDGELIAEVPVSELDYDGLVRMMVGRQLTEQFPYAEPRADGEVVLRVRHLSNALVHDVSFDLRRGQVVGIAGLAGAGRTELAKTIYGVYPVESGSIEVLGKPVTITSPSEAIRHGIFYISEDRKGEGLILGLDVKSNITLSGLRKITRHGSLDLAAEKRIGTAYTNDLRIRTPSLTQLVRNLSGGNQQKTALAKGLMSDPEVLVLDEPTRGIDVGAKKEIYTLINALKESGKAILLISSEMPEVLGMSDQILVMHEGSIRAQFARGDATQEKIMATIV